MTAAGQLFFRRAQTFLMLGLWVSICTALAFGATAAKADQKTQAAEIAVLIDEMGLDEIIAIMREEGLSYGKELGADMLSGGGGATWRQMVDRIYDTDVMAGLVVETFTDSFGEADAAPLIDFFRSESGRQIVTLEIAARRAFMDAQVEEAAREEYRRVASDLAADSPRNIDAHLAAIDSYIQTNDLVGYNVMGAMNANMLFYRGLIEGGAFEMSETDLLADVWSQEEETQSETREWIYAFLMLAYEPLDAQQINSYVDLSRTPSGRALNRALFAAFDRMYGTMSQALGVAIAGQMLGEEL
jgi:hypothetical protein